MANKRKREVIFAQQDYHCALCGRGGLISDDICLDRTGKVVCNRCNHYLAGWRHARSNSITEEKTVAFNTSADDNKTGDTQ